MGGVLLSYRSCLLGGDDEHQRGALQLVDAAGPPDSVTIGRPACSHARIPPDRLTALMPWEFISGVFVDHHAYRLRGVARRGANLQTDLSQVDPLAMGHRLGREVELGGLAE